MTTAEEAYKAAMDAHKLIGSRNTVSDNNVLANNILEGDLGYFSNRGLQNYDLDKETRDRLIAHARQDAALAVINSSSILNELKKIRSAQTIILIMVASMFFYTFFWR